MNPFRPITTASILSAFGVLIKQLIVLSDKQTAKAQAFSDKAAILRDKQQACLLEADTARGAIQRLQALIGGN